MSSLRIATALGCLLVLATQVYADPAQPTQVPAGSTAAIDKAVTPSATATDTPQGKMLKSALSTGTRQTLQSAMDSAPATH